MTEESAPNRRPRAVAALFLLAAAGLLWGASRMRWAQVYTEDGLGEPRVFDVVGSDWSPWLLAVALLFLAALAVQFVLHGIVLRVVAIVVALGAILVAVPAISMMTSGANNLYAAETIDLPARSDVIAVTTFTGAGVLALLAALCAVVGAVLMSRSASGASKMSSKYTSPAARRADLERQVFADRDRAQSEREFWDALDHGVDPTSGPDGGDPGDRAPKGSI
ncbi:MAG: TIGR02234 family membrane protein [Gordonia sp. (in: high G+C Gram-positive bacteria)]|uniref:TIGR02234 family membrane protein n=1 Tax=Gordonia sp. (in: high G+C Gram-positive bacteria) TaxID=84139 RepID=UPI003BB641F1